MTDKFQNLINLGIRPLKNAQSDLKQYLKNHQAAASDLPEDKGYRDFLNHFSQTSVFDKEVCFTGQEASAFSDHGKEFLEALFAECEDSNNDLFSLREKYAEQLPDNLFVIGEVTGGNLICLDKNAGDSVKVWDRTVSGDLSQSLFHIADSFLDFIDLLEETQDDVSDNSNAPKVVNYTPSEIMKAKVAEYLKKQNK
ncbi:SMI1 / KNR4 family protein [Vibrio aerogenes CECT 7868]|uniref:SMI1 / KNR4 family protein n=1 Tax=Vibrio aerogenes CECT 7868 TaxID=1216006 RepID=A0A1M5ZEY7_9VIBR|nr:SMI1/KNR4 family protein [Vibrio aerogenes]SHI22721.1 SMI1 / KNR4 family protein [Vibrio aerogenes CECT 7868]